MLLTPEELATIVTDLLVDPGSVGELEDAKTYERFLEQIAQAVCDNCGGTVTFISPPDFDRSDVAAKDQTLYADATSYMVHVHGNDNLPDPETNIWRHHGFYPSGALFEALPEEED